MRSAASAVRGVNVDALTRGAPDAPPLRNEALAPGMRVGLFGGSFNPIHSGHRHVADTVMKRLGLDRVWWIVSPQNPLKSSKNTSAHARRMSQVESFVDAPRMVVSDVERRIGARYTIDTVGALRARHPDVKFVWVMGADNLAGFHLWKGWREIMALVPVAIVARPGQRLAARLGRAAAHFAHRRIPEHQARRLVEMEPPAWVYLTARLHPASSTALRAARSRSPK